MYVYTQQCLYKCMRLAFNTFHSVLEYARIHMNFVLISVKAKALILAHAIKVILPTTLKQKVLIHMRGGKPILIN